MNKETTSKKQYSIASNINYILKNIWGWDKVVFVYAGLQAATGVLLPFMNIYLPKLVLDQVSGYTSFGRLVGVLTGFTALMVAVNMVNKYVVSSINTSSMSNRMHYYFLRNQKTMDCDYEHLESAKGQIRYQKLNDAVLNDRGGPQAIVKVLPSFLSSVIGFFLYSGILTLLNPIVLIILILSSGLNYGMLHYVTRFREKYREERAKCMRKFYYLYSESANFQTAKDVRLYSMKPWFLSIFQQVLKEDRKRLVREHKKEYLPKVADAAILLVRDGIAYAYLIYYILQGNIGISDFVLYFGAITGFSAFVTEIVSNYNEIVRSSLDITAVREFLDMPDTSNRGVGLPLPGSGPRDELPLSIRFKNVYFRYEADGDYVLKDFNLELKKGEKLALVGTNGAGKTTLVKLLCGFYRPTSGEIYINDKPLSGLNRDAAYSLFSAVFQDILVLPFSVAKNIAMCEEKDIDREKVKNCLKLAGLQDRLPDLDALLTKVMTADGIELSGGEQQKLLLARALYKNAPILLLDEPTAALDPIAESILYQRYNDFSAGKTSIYISHRLASTSFCDRVAFMEDGRISEEGTHAELLKNKGGYSKMYEIQSHYYKTESRSKKRRGNQ